MNDIFTIVSLFMAVSGATYTALIAWRDVFHARVTKIGEDTIAHHNTIKECPDRGIIDAGTDKYSRIRWWILLWRWAQAIPVVLFLLSVFAVGIHLLIVSWNNTHITSDGWWEVYKWVLLALIVLDGLSILILVIAYFRIRSHNSDFMEWVQQANKVKSQQYKSLPPAYGPSVRRQRDETDPRS